MCDYKLLAHNEDGYVILCNSCQHCQLAFGIMLVTFSPGNYKQFFRQVNRQLDAGKLPGFEKQKRFIIDVFAVSTMMTLSYLELVKLAALVNESSFNAEFEALFTELKVNRE